MEKTGKKIRDAHHLDLCFLVVVTGSMSGHIAGVKESIRSIVDELTIKPTDLVVKKIRLAFVGYRDFGDSRQFEVLDFVELVDEFHKFCGTIVATGGGDTPEDVFGGIEKAIALNWTIDGSTRMIFHIADAPCHGREFHSCDDSYPGGDPSGRSIQTLFGQINSKQIQYFFGKITARTAEMIKKFSIVYGNEIIVCDVKDPKQILGSVVSSATTAISRGRKMDVPSSRSCLGAEVNFSGVNMSEPFMMTPDGHSKHRIGIDLGTTNSLVTFSDTNGKLIVVKNRQNKTLTPSCVSFSEDNADVLIGIPALRKKSSNYKNTIFDVKRLLGKSFDDESVQNFREKHSFLMRNIGGKPVIEVVHNGEPVFFRPLDISALVLTSLRECVEEKLRGTSDARDIRITSAVITVPAYFSQAKKSETIEAAKLAGLIEVDLITEPTAAAFGYGFAIERYDGYRVLVFDFGGGTFDVSVLEIQNGNFVTRCIEGDPNLGGRDIDEKLFDHCAAIIKERWGKDCTSDLLSKQKLMEMCEELKITLSTQDEESIYLGYIFPELRTDLTVSRETLNSLSKPLFMLAIGKVKQALRASGFNPEDINEVYLVGGVSRTPQITDLLITELGFEDEKLNKNIDPDEAVAYGAGVYAAKLAGILKSKVPMSIVEVIPLSLGTNVLGGIFSPIIPRGSIVPYKITQIFDTIANNQYSMSFEIFEGERKLAQRNNKLGCLEINGLTPGMAGKVSAELTLEIDRNGILHVTATHEGKKAVMKMKYEMRSGSEPDVEELIRDAREHQEGDTLEEERTEARSNLQLAIEQAKYQCTDKIILAKCMDYEDWLTINVNASADTYKNKYNTFKGEV